MDAVQNAQAQTAPEAVTYQQPIQGTVQPGQNAAAVFGQQYYYPAYAPYGQIPQVPGQLYAVAYQPGAYGTPQQQRPAALPQPAAAYNPVGYAQTQGYAASKPTVSAPPIPQALPGGVVIPGTPSAVGVAAGNEPMADGAVPSVALNLPQLGTILPPAMAAVRDAAVPPIPPPPVIPAAAEAEEEETETAQTQEAENTAPVIACECVCPEATDTPIVPAEDTSATDSEIIVTAAPPPPSTFSRKVPEIDPNKAEAIPLNNDGTARLSFPARPVRSGDDGPVIPPIPGQEWRQSNTPKEIYRPPQALGKPVLQQPPVYGTPEPTAVADTQETAQTQTAPAAVVQSTPSGGYYYTYPNAQNQGYAVNPAQASADTQTAAPSAAAETAAQSAAAPSAAQTAATQKQTPSVPPVPAVAPPPSMNVIEAPMYIRAHCYSAEEVTLFWGRVEGADGYIILRGPDAKSMKPVAFCEEDTYGDRDVLPGTIYFYAVRAYNERGTSTSCAPAQIIVPDAAKSPAALKKATESKTATETAAAATAETAPPEPPKAPPPPVRQAYPPPGNYGGCERNIPAIPAPPAIQPASAPPPPAPVKQTPAYTSYTQNTPSESAYFGQNPQPAPAAPPIPAASDTATQASPSIAPLPSAQNTSVSGTTSARPAYIPQLPPPKAPASLRAVARGTQQVDLFWRPSEGAQSYRIYRSISPWDSYSLCGETRELSYTDTVPREETKYYYFVQAIANGNASEPSPMDSATTFPALPLPEPPVNVVATAVSPTAINLSWEHAKAAAAYIVSTRASADQSFESAGTVYENTFVHEGLEPGTWHEYRVQSYHQNGVSEPSAPVGTTTRQAETATNAWQPSMSSSQWQFYPPQTHMEAVQPQPQPETNEPFTPQYGRYGYAQSTPAQAQYAPNLAAQTNAPAAPAQYLFQQGVPQQSPAQQQPTRTQGGRGRFPMFGSSGRSRLFG
jgi:hypothetical protein